MYLHESPIIDFYPEKFPIDSNGKRFAWQGVAILPFVGKNRLQATMALSYSNLTEAQQDANKRGIELLWVGCHNQAYEPLCEMYAKPDQITKFPGGVIPGSASRIADFAKSNPVISAVCHMPEFPAGFIFEFSVDSENELAERELDEEDRENFSRGRKFQKQAGLSNATRFLNGNLLGPSKRGKKFKR